MFAVLPVLFSPELMAAATIPMKMNTNSTPTRKVPIMEANMNLKNCLIKSAGFDSRHEATVVLRLHIRAIHERIAPGMEGTNGQWMQESM